MNTNRIENIEIFQALEEFKKLDHKIIMNISVAVEDTNGRKYDFSYADLAEIEAKIRPSLESCRLSYIQTVCEDCSVITTLIHLPSQQTISSKSSFPMEPGHTYQSYGQAITYLRRYSLVSMLGLRAEQDSDANTADGNKATFKVNGKPKLDHDRMQMMVDYLKAGKVKEVERSINKYDLTDSQRLSLTTLINHHKSQATMEEANV